MKCVTAPKHIGNNFASAICVSRQCQITCKQQVSAPFHLLYCDTSISDLDGNSSCIWISKLTYLSKGNLLFQYIATNLAVAYCSSVLYVLHVNDIRLYSCNINLLNKHLKKFISTKN